MNSQAIYIGTRGSPLALAQSGMIRNQLASLWPGHRFELTVIKTTGDALQEAVHKPLASTKAVFTKEIEEALLAKRVDLAVHSAKDLAAEMPEGLCLGAVPERASPCDILVLKPGSFWQDATDGLVLTGSARRRRQWMDLHPRSSVEPVRGNIDTRLKKLLDHPRACALLLAEAGLRRLEPDLLGCSLQQLSPASFIPAPGQGCLAIQCREKDSHILELLNSLNHSPSSLVLRAERAFLNAMNAGCSVPLGALASVNAHQLEMISVFYPAEDVPALRYHLTGLSHDPEALGFALAAKFTPDK